MEKIIGLTGIESGNGDKYRIFINDNKEEVTLYAPNNVGILIPFTVFGDYVDYLQEIRKSNNIK